MSKIRYLGAETASVPLLQRDVQPDELVEVDDDLLKTYDWPESLWSVEEKKSTSKSKG